MLYIKSTPAQIFSPVSPPRLTNMWLIFWASAPPKMLDSDLSKIEESVLATMRPLTSAWEQLEKGGLKQNPDLLVPGMKCTMRWFYRRANILEAVDTTWAKYGTEEFPSASEPLFGEDFHHQASGERCKAVSTLKRSEKDNPI